MTIGYVNTRGQLITKTIEDIRKLAGGASSFTQGETAEFTTLIPGIERISYVQIEPKNNSEAKADQKKAAASWNLKSLSFCIDETDYKEPMTIPIYTQIAECTREGETPKKYNLSNISVSVSAKLMGEVGFAKNSTITLTGKSGETLNMDIEVLGSISGYGYTYKIEQSMGGGRLTVKSETRSDSSNLSFVLPENNTQYEMQYYITICSEESPSISSVIKVYVPMQEVKSEPEVEIKTNDSEKDSSEEEKTTKGSIEINNPDKMLKNEEPVKTIDLQNDSDSGNAFEKFLNSQQ